MAAICLFDWAEKPQPNYLVVKNYLHGTFFMCLYDPLHDQPQVAMRGISKKFLKSGHFILFECSPKGIS